MIRLFNKSGINVLRIAFILSLIPFNLKAGSTAAMSSGNELLPECYSIFPDSARQSEVNKKLVADFYQQLFGDKDITAIDRYIGDVYIQHNPSLKDGKDELKKAATQWFKGAPKEKINIQHLGADGNFVYIHTKAIRGNGTVSVIDIFRLENGKITEHWDVIQEVPKQSINPHPMF